MSHDAQIDEPDETMAGQGGAALDDADARPGDTLLVGAGLSPASDDDVDTGEDGAVAPIDPPAHTADRTSDDRVEDACTTAGFDQDPHLLCANLTLCVIEILAGARALDQVARWVTDAVFVHLVRRTVIAARARAASGEDSLRPRVRIGEPFISPLGDSIVEAVVMVHQPTRSRAVAMRLERHRTRWRATAISVL